MALRGPGPGPGAGLGAGAGAGPGAGAERPGVWSRGGPVPRCRVSVMPAPPGKPASACSPRGLGAVPVRRAWAPQ